VPLRPESRFHRWLVPELETFHATRGQRLNVLAPRGAAKTSWVSIAYPLWCACERHEEHVVILSDTQRLSQKLLGQVRRELENNAPLAASYPDACGKGPSWKVDSLVLRNGVLIEAFSTGGNVRGTIHRSRRPSLVIGDDLQNKDHVVSALKRYRCWQWLTRDVLPVGTPDTNFLILGTALHREAIVCRLQTTPGWRSRLFKSIEKWTERMDLWQEWEQLLLNWEDPDREARAREFYEQNRRAMEE
jgi:hypothetical protein